MSDQQTPHAGVPTCYRHPDRESHIRCQRCDRPICPDCMRDAAVGFQCPSCIAEGAKSTRSGRTAYGGLRPTNASVTSLGIIIANVGVWLAIMATGGNTSRLVPLLGLRPNGGCYVSAHQTLDVSQGPCPGIWVHAVDDGAWWQLVTNMFVHVEVWHIGFNMLALWVLGPQMELATGRVRFLALYLLSGLSASTLVYLASPENVLTYGASGAVFGLMGALLVLALKVRGDVSGIIGWIAINFVVTFWFVGRISWQGHVGGFLGGIVIAAILVYAPRQRRTVWQAAGLGAFAAAMLVAIVVRSVALT